MAFRINFFLHKKRIFSDFSIIENIYYKKVGKPYARLWIKDEVV
jgi:hypothetical protein